MIRCQGMVTRYSFPRQLPARTAIWPEEAWLVSHSDTQAALDVSAPAKTKSSSRGKPSARKAYVNDLGALLVVAIPNQIRVMRPASSEQ